MAVHHPKCYKHPPTVYESGKAMSMSRLDRIPPASAAGAAGRVAASSQKQAQHAAAQQQARRPIGHTPKKLSMSMGHLGNNRAALRSLNSATSGGSPAAGQVPAAMGRPPRHHKGPPVSQSAKAKYIIKDEGWLKLRDCCSEKRMGVVMLN